MARWTRPREPGSIAYLAGVTHVPPNRNNLRGLTKSILDSALNRPERLVHRNPHPAIRFILDAMLVVTCVLWLPVVRGLFQPDYQWQLLGLGGHGRAGNYAVLLGLVAFAWSVLYLGWRRNASTAFSAGLLVWWLGLTSALTWSTLASDEPLVLRGDTLNIELPIGWIGAGLAAALLALAGVGLLAQRRRAVLQPTWALGNRIALAIATLLVAVEAGCFVGSPVDSTSSQIGVGAVLAQVLALGLSIRTRRSRVDSRVALPVGSCFNGS
jgi:hypothetical protein